MKDEAPDFETSTRLTVPAHPQFAYLSNYLDTLIGVSQLTGTEKKALDGQLRLENCISPFPFQIAALELLFRAKLAVELMFSGSLSNL